jgi:hypothetical protein
MGRGEGLAVIQGLRALLAPELRARCCRRRRFSRSCPNVGGYLDVGNECSATVEYGRESPGLTVLKRTAHQQQAPIREHP